MVLDGDGNLEDEAQAAGPGPFRIPPPIPGQYPCDGIPLMDAAALGRIGRVPKTFAVQIPELPHAIR